MTYKENTSGLADKDYQVAKIHETFWICQFFDNSYCCYLCMSWIIYRVMQLDVNIILWMIVKEDCQMWGDIMSLTAMTSFFGCILLISFTLLFDSTSNTMLQFSAVASFIYSSSLACYNSSFSLFLWCLVLYVSTHHFVRESNTTEQCKYYFR